MKIEINDDLCIGCGICSSICPEIFEIKEDGKCHVISENFEVSDAKEAEESCPEQAIIIKE